MDSARNAQDTGTGEGPPQPGWGQPKFQMKQHSLNWEREFKALPLDYKAAIGGRMAPP